MPRRAGSAAKKTPHAKTKAGGTVKKTYNLPPKLVARAKRSLKAKNETEAVIMALERVADEDEIYSAIRSVSGSLPDFHRGSSYR